MPYKDKEKQRQAQAKSAKKNHAARMVKQRERRKSAPSRYKGIEHLRLTRYNLSPEQVQRMLEEQNYTCVFCPKPLTAETCKVDHDHTCCPSQVTCGACVRGLLCMGCNTRLGWYERRKDLIDRYLS